MAKTKIQKKNTSRSTAKVVVKKRSATRSDSLKKSPRAATRLPSLPLFIHPMSTSQGVVYKTRRHAVVALRRSSADIFVAASSLRPARHKEDAILTWPVVRGISFLVELLAVYSFAYTHNKEIVREQRKQFSLWGRFVDFAQRGTVVMLWVILLVAVVEFLLMYLTDIPVVSTYLITDMIRLLVSLIVFVALFFLTSFIARAESETLSYHIAAQKVLAVYEADGAITESALMRGPYLLDRTMVPMTFWTLLFVVMGLTLFNWTGDNIILQLMVLVGVVSLSFGLAYELVGYAARTRGQIYTVVIKPFQTLQTLLTHRPTKKHFEVALIALMSLQSLEK